MLVSCQALQKGEGGGKREPGCYCLCMYQFSIAKVNNSTTSDVNTWTRHMLHKAIT